MPLLVFCGSYAGLIIRALLLTNRRSGNTAATRTIAAMLGISGTVEIEVLVEVVVVDDVVDDVPLE
jgi:hypothetical protein